MGGVIYALLPVFGVVLLGFFLKRYGFPANTFWPQADRITYYIFFPVLLVDKLTTAHFSRPELIPMSLILMMSVLFIAGLVASLRLRLNQSPASFTSILQGSIRPNTYVGLAAASSLYGSEGLALTALALAGVIPLVNVISVFAFVRLIPMGKSNMKAVFINLLRNPIILACLLGLSINFGGITLPGSLQETLNIVGRPALTVGLLSVGAGLKLSTLGSNTLALGLSSFFKLLLLPFLVWALSIYFGIDGMARTIAVLYGALPCSVASYSLSTQMGGNKDLMASIITLQTLLAMLSMTLMISLSQSGIG